jgi:hypothetical protein
MREIEGSEVRRKEEEKTWSHLEITHSYGEVVSKNFRIVEEGQLRHVTMYNEKTINRELANKGWSNITNRCKEVQTIH